MYANPPPLTQTLFGGGGAATGADAATGAAADEAAFGPSQWLLSAGAVALVGVLVLASGISDLGPSLSGRTASSVQVSVLV